MNTTTNETILDGYMKDAQGRLVPEHMVKPVDLLEDQTVHTAFEFAEQLHAQINRFRGHTVDDITTFLETVEEKYQVKKGGPKGNVTLSSFDGLRRITVQRHDYLTFGPELQIAKDLFDECVAEWSANADDKVRVLVDHAFQVNKVGQINRASLFGLRALEIDDPIWKRAIEALNNSIRVQGSKSYVRFQHRKTTDQPWTTLTLDLASAKAPANVTPGEQVAS